MFPADWNALMTSLLPYKQETNCCIQTSCWSWVGGGHRVRAGAWVARATGSPCLKGTSPQPLNKQFGAGLMAARAATDPDHQTRPLQQGRPEVLPRAQHVSEGRDQNHDSARSASVCCSRVLCWTHPANSRNLGNSTLPIQRSCGHRNLMPWKSVSDAKPQKYQLIYSLQINTSDKVHNSQEAFSPAHFVICTSRFLSVFYSVCKLRESIL